MRLPLENFTFSYNRNLLFLYSVSVDFNSDFFQSRLLLLPVFPPFPPIFLSVLPGTALLLLCWISNGAIGLADGLIVLALGIWIGFWELLGVLSGAFFLSFFVAGFLFFFHKKNRTETIPFIPFLLAGMFLNLFFSQSV